MARRAAEKGRSVHRGPLSRVLLVRRHPGTIPATYSAVCRCGAIFTDGGNTISGRLGFHSPACSAKLAALIRAPTWTAITKGPRNGQVGRYAGFDNYETVFAPTHTVGPLGGTR